MSVQQICCVFPSSSRPCWYTVRAFFHSVLEVLSRYSTQFLTTTNIHQTCCSFASENHIYFKSRLSCCWHRNGPSRDKQILLFKFDAFSKQWSSIYNLFGNIHVIQLINKVNPVNPTYFNHGCLEIYELEREASSVALQNPNRPETS